jgi:hypothetical protein
VRQRHRSIRCACACRCSVRRARRGRVCQRRVGRRRGGTRRCAHGGRGGEGRTGR